MIGSPTEEFLTPALASGAHFVVADFEDSSTVALSSLLNGMMYGASHVSLFVVRFLSFVFLG